MNMASFFRITGTLHLFINNVVVSAHWVKLLHKRIKREITHLASHFDC